MFITPLPNGQWASDEDIEAARERLDALVTKWIEDEGLSEQSIVALHDRVVVNERKYSLLRDVSVGRNSSVQ